MIHFENIYFVFVLSFTFYYANLVVFSVFMAEAVDAVKDGEGTSLVLTAPAWVYILPININNAHRLVKGDSGVFLYL